MNTDHQKVFDTIVARVKQSPYWDRMISTVENSPWHREVNVKTHTEMVIQAYDDHLALFRDPQQQLITKLALLFHDFGKPQAEKTLSREDGTQYRRYAGHEVISANLFLDFIASNTDLRNMLENVGIKNNELRAIRLMIEHHLPYSYTDEMMSIIKLNLVELLGHNWTVFQDMLISDCRGRISDDHATKIKNTEEWIEKFNQISLPTKPKKNDTQSPTMTILVGVSGIGKSTYARNSGLFTYCWDDIRVKLYLRHNAPEGDDKAIYAKAFKWCNDNPALFRGAYQSELKKLLKKGVSFCIDNMCTSRKRRREFISAARQHGYTINIVEFVAPLHVVCERQSTRPDKFVPLDVVTQTYLNTQIPLYQGVDDSGKPNKYGEAESITTVYAY